MTRTGSSTPKTTVLQWPNRTRPMRTETAWATHVFRGLACGVSKPSRRVGRRRFSATRARCGTSVFRSARIIMSSALKPVLRLRCSFPRERSANPSSSTSRGIRCPGPQWATPRRRPRAPRDAVKLELAPSLARRRPRRFTAARPLRTAPPPRATGKRHPRRADWSGVRAGRELGEPARMDRHTARRVGAREHAGGLSGYAWA